MSNALKDYAALSDKSPRAWGKEGGFEQRLNKKFEALARQRLAKLGEDAFLERHWTKLAKSAREADESLRRRDGLPKPAGLAAFQECVELAREASAPVERPRPKSL